MGDPKPLSDNYHNKELHRRTVLLDTDNGANEQREGPAGDRQQQQQQRWPRYYNFFATRSFNKPFNETPNFINRLLWKLPYVPRSAVIALMVVGGVTMYQQANANGFGFFMSFVPFGVRYLRNYDKRKFTFYEQPGMPYPWNSEDTEDGELFSEEWLEYWQTYVDERGIDWLDRLDYRKKKGMSRENMMMHAMYMGVLGLEYDNVWRMFKRGETTDPWKELKIVPVDERTVHNYGEWIPPPLPSELRYPTVPVWDGAYSREKQRQLNTRTKDFVVTEDLVFGSHHYLEQLTKLQKREILEQYDDRMKTQIDIELPTDYRRQINLENRHFRFSGTYFQESENYWPNFNQRPYFGSPSFDVFG